MSYLNKKRRKVLERLLVPQGAEEAAILQTNQAIRSDLTLRQEDGLAYRFRIPDRHLDCIRRMIPELRTLQPSETQVRAWKWFLRDSISRPYRVKA